MTIKTITIDEQAQQQAFEYSTDHNALWDFICIGGDALGFVDYRFRGDSQDEPPMRDPVRIKRRAPYQITFSARGISYGDITPTEKARWPDEKELFLKACNNLNLEWAKPALPPAPSFWLDKESGLTCTHKINPCDVPVFCTDGEAALLMMSALELWAFDKRSQHPAPIPTSERLPTEAKFEREWRYIVIKRKKLLEYSLGDYLTAEKVEKRILDQIPDEALVECVVIESDWPEYEQVWKMLEARCTGLTRPAEPGGE